MAAVIAVVEAAMAAVMSTPSAPTAKSKASRFKSIAPSKADRSATAARNVGSPTWSAKISSSLVIIVPRLSIAKFKLSTETIGKDTPEPGSGASSLGQSRVLF